MIVSGAIPSRAFVVVRFQSVLLPMPSVAAPAPFAFSVVLFELFSMFGSVLIPSVHAPISSVPPPVPAVPAPTLELCPV